MPRTPGPWTPHGATVYAGDVMVATARREYFRELYEPEMVETQGRTGAMVNIPLPEARRETYDNTVLISAAPDLLDALEELLLVPNKQRPDYVWDDAREAVRKAKGE